MNNLKFVNKKVAILGLGIEGVALAEFLIPECEDITLLDQKTEDSLLADGDNAELAKVLENQKLKKILGESYLDNLIEYDLIFRSPGIPIMNKKIQEAKENGVEISSQIKLFFELCPCQIIGVTGTKGKGTTASLIFEILKNKLQITNYKLQTKSQKLNSNESQNIYLAGNIGRPAINLIKKLKSEDIVILELSSFQTQDLTKSPHIAVITNISVDHLDYHKDEKEYAEAKESIVKFQNNNDFAIINQDYLTSFEFSSLTEGKVLYFSGKNSVDEGSFIRKIQDTRYLPAGRHGNNHTNSNSQNSIISDYEVVLRMNGTEDVICRSDEIKLVGKHNLENIAAAVIATRICGASMDDIKVAVKAFAPLPHRIEFVREINRVKFFNDSYATNPDPTMAAIRSFSEDKILILGGSSKGASFDELAMEIADSSVVGVVLIGDEASNIKNSLSKSGYSGKTVRSGMDFNLAINEARGLASSGDVVIFSPSCASFDMFKNYKDRGDQFKRIVLGFE